MGRGVVVKIKKMASREKKILIEVSAKNKKNQ